MLFVCTVEAVQAAEQLLTHPF